MNLNLKESGWTAAHRSMVAARRAREESEPDVQTLRIVVEKPVVPRAYEIV